MSWDSIDVEGTQMWKRCDGTILPNGEAISAFEKWEHDKFIESQEKRVDVYEVPETVENIEPAPIPLWLAVVWIVAGISLMIYVCVK
jgi:hypothetical protein